MLSDSEIQRIARLARIDVNASEIAALHNKLNGILTLVDEMRAVDTTGIEPLSHVQDIGQRLREDVVTESNQRDAFQAIAPATEAGLYLVPKVIE
jgi:aspartyl-tRNA(Asn)/glutamyl-tRNA(Gln) amidotransferase subunit C